MKLNPYPVPVRRRGVRRKNKSFDFDEPLIKALVWFAEKENRKYKEKVSQAAIIKKALLETYPALREKYMALKEKEIKERIHASKEVERPRNEPTSKDQPEESDIRATAAQFDDRQNNQD